MCAMSGCRAPPIAAQYALHACVGARRCVLFPALRATRRASDCRAWAARAARQRRAASSAGAGRLRVSAVSSEDPTDEPQTLSASLLSSLQNLLFKGEETVVLAEAAAVGLLTGGAVVLLNDAIHASHHLSWGAFGLGGAGVDPGSRWPVVLLLPCAAGGAVSALRAWVGGFDGVAGGDAEPPWRAAARPVAKACAAALTLGGGVPLGPEGPSVQLGSGVAAALQRLSPSSEQRRLSLLAAGSAAGLSAGFGATLAGAFFAFEAVLQPSSAAGRAGDPPSLTASLVLLSAVLASLVSRAGLGEQPTFVVPDYDLFSLGELPLFLGLGAAAGGVSLAFAAAGVASERFVAALEARGMPPALLPPLGGLLAGSVALFYPEILYDGFNNVDAILAAPRTIYPPLLLLQLVAAKVGATACARACGLVGGVYAPSLFMGAALGAAYGAAAGQLPFAAALGVGSPAAYALLGMAATLAAICRVPLTAVLLMFEYTQDFRMLLPLMATVGVASWVASVADERAAAGLAASGVEEETERAEAERVRRAAAASALASGDRELGDALGKDALVARTLRELPVTRAMRTQYLTVPGDASLIAAAAAMVTARERACVLASADGALLGVLTHDAVQRALDSPQSGAARPDQPGGAVAACAQAGGAFQPKAASGRVHPDTPLADALAALTGGGLRQLAVVPRDMPRPPAVGLLEAEAVGDACQLELTQRALRRTQRAAGSAAQQ